MQRANKSQDPVEEERNVKAHILLNTKTFCQMWYWHKKRQTNQGNIETQI